MTLTLAAGVADRIAAHARQEAPRECCGLLLGVDGSVSDIVPARNELSATTAYVIDPRDHFAAIRQARALKLDVVGAFHSHPASAPVPSPRDLAEAWPAFVYLIVSLSPACRAQPMRAWILEGGNFVELEIVTPTEEVRNPPCLPDSR